MLIGFNVAFGPMHIAGLQGQPRRTYRYPEGMGWDLVNALSTIGAAIIAISIVVFAINVARTMRSPPRAPEDPWDARTLEWATSSSPPEYNFAGAWARPAGGAQHRPGQRPAARMRVPPTSTDRTGSITGTPSSVGVRSRSGWR